jgi:mersacidin/lichenicidin family type 2 lantibiotic
MKKDDLIKALKDERFREGLTPEDQAAMPSNPAGIVELSDEDMELVVGGLAAQTGTGSPNCECVITRTAVSGGGSCNCTCPDPEPKQPDIA